LAVLDLIGQRAQFVTGVPDSVLRGFIGALDGASGIHHCVAVNEGAAVAMASGWTLGSGRPAVVYMQNSGLGNALNPLLSLMHRDVYSLPVVMLIGWRGAGSDEPQHLPQGRVTRQMLEIAGVGVSGVIEASDAAATLYRAFTSGFAHCLTYATPTAILVKPGVLDWGPTMHPEPMRSKLSRLEAIQTVLDAIPDTAALVASTGHMSRELASLRSSGGTSDMRDFLVVGSMGHASSIALGIALAQPERLVVCLDGDGALLMHMGSLTTIGTTAPPNFCHVVLNNGRHDSVDGPLTTASTVNICRIAQICQYNAMRTATLEGLRRGINQACEGTRPAFIEVLVKAGGSANLGRPAESPGARKARFVTAIQPVL
jgi:phosphonopyruvate decarboxylase